MSKGVVHGEMGKVPTSMAFESYKDVDQWAHQNKRHQQVPPDLEGNGTAFTIYVTKASCTKALTLCPYDFLGI